MPESNDFRKISRALVSVFHKEPARELIEYLHASGVEILSTGGTSDYIRSLGIPVHTVEDLTAYPAILGGRVKTLHPAVFGGILARRNEAADLKQLKEYNIPFVDLVVVDLYPFKQAVSDGLTHQEIIEKIDIGGISLIRAAAKNFHDVCVLARLEQADQLIQLLKDGGNHTGLEDRKRMAKMAFGLSSEYDRAIHQYLAGDDTFIAGLGVGERTDLRYGENPHQSGRFYGQLQEIFDQLQGKALSYNNLLDIDAAMCLMAEFSEPCFAIVKHTNVCGLASGPDMIGNWQKALAGDPLSAFGGILITNGLITEELAGMMEGLFFEVLIGGGFDAGSREIFLRHSKRILLQVKKNLNMDQSLRSVLNGVLWQTIDNQTIPASQWKIVTSRVPTTQEMADLEVANIAVKHLKSNAISLVKHKQLIGMGAGQTSRVDAMKQAIGKARAFGHELQGAVMASDAFFPFADSVEIAHQAGITAVVQPGGSIKDQDSIRYCEAAGMSLAMTGRRHFKH